LHAATDLNGGGQGEVLVYLMGSWFCGTGGCTLHIYRPSAEGYDLVQDIPLSRMPVVAADSHSEGWREGWRDLWQLQSGGGMPAGFIRYQFNGSRYRQTERIPANQGRPKGLLLLSGNPSLAGGQLEA
jgi:hypothetical protein